MKMKKRQCKVYTNLVYLVVLPMTSVTDNISKTDWDKTPKTVKKLVKQLVGTLNVVVIPE